MRDGIGSEFGWFQLGLKQAVAEDLSIVNQQTFANGRAALRQAIRLASSQVSTDADTFLLPAYLCHSMVQPFVEEGVRFEFYPVTESLVVDLVGLMNRVNNRTLGVLLVHYFGYLQPKSVIEWLQQHRDLFVIEDSTHSWLSSYDQYGDVTVVSPRKMLPLPDLAWLTINSPRARSGLERVPVPKGIDWRFAVSRSLALAIRGIYFRWPSSRVKQLAFSLFHYAEKRLDGRVLVRQSSSLSKALFRYFPLRHYAKARRKNYRFLLEGVSQLCCIRPLFAQLPEEVVPLGFPILTNERDWVKVKLVEASIYPPIHWLLPAEIDPGQFPLSTAISSKVLTIPIDQRYEERHMQYVLDRLQQIDRVLKNRRDMGEYAN